MPRGLENLTSLQSLSTFNVVDDDSNKADGKLNELQNLNNLRGNLEINGLDRVKTLMETSDVNLVGKKFLESLDLNWEAGQPRFVDEEALLDILRLHQHLRRLNVVGGASASQVFEYM
ncbi:hypothetical protein TSUD_276820 [Trifolium subterraneum]|uniref:R13L1/DRL21-like LRR repeat region domain-containing protein n=1 Tax=Trifolium subterraneum TaxID=3900 RepID=A0A2Z6N973_TRISU|nr:hypothetical protein TSUD_276820 [Trifolium subterraneum]